MAPLTPQVEEKDNSHQILLDQLDIASVPKPFRSQSWKPSQRRNKNIKQIVSEAQRKEASVLATQNNSGAATPQPAAATGTSDGSLTPAVATGGAKAPNIAQAAQSLSTLVLEKNLQRAMLPTGPTVTYTNIESAPSLHPAHQKHYCDITGLPAKYRDPKTRLWYHDKEVFGVLRTLPQGVPEQYLAARGAHTILK
ncbi:putative chromatin-remodeling complex subunit ies6 [Phaeomoniella chlamydospora]|uniref:Putative chromatin-remodeling complex subunit ies6 n=1 Tax=Phaeomoniella chlamydospora TaxID=158046 RepID=A0A0G2EVX9_PHACM|nr:putative chromatin-remodeling complex subunit ies6 [Phaeomoniella chlamydospora]